ncbi:hypothetical protein Tco_0127505 [Tanacetum coccineum]
MLARIAEAAALSPPSFRKRYRSSYETSSSSSPTLLVRKRYRDTDDERESQGLDDEGHGLGDEDHGLYDKSQGLEDERHSLEREEAAPEGQQQAVTVVSTSVNEPLGLGYGAARRSALDSMEEITPSTYEDDKVYTDIPAYAPLAALVQTPSSLEWSLGSLLVSPSSPVVQSPTASPVATSAATILIDEDQFIERYRFRSLKQEQERATVTFRGLWRPVLALEAWAGHVDTRLADMSRDRCVVSKVVLLSVCHAALVVLHDVLRALVLEYPLWVRSLRLLPSDTRTDSSHSSASSDSTTPLSPDHPLTHVSPTPTPTRASFHHRTVRITVCVQPTMSPGHSARVTEAMAVSDSAFRKRYRSSYETPSPSPSLTLQVRKRYKGTSELILDTNSKGDKLGDKDIEEDESLDANDDRERLDDEGLGLEEEEAAPEASQGGNPVSHNHGYNVQISKKKGIHESILHDHTQCLDALPPTLIMDIDRDLRELYTRSGVVRGEIFSQRYMFRSLQTRQERLPEHSEHCGIPAWHGGMAGQGRVAALEQERGRKEP